MIRSAVLSRRPRRLQRQSTLVPTRRQRAVSAAVVAPPPRRRTRTGHCGCSRCSGRRDRIWWKPCHSTLPAPPAGKPRARAAALSLPMCAPLSMRTHAQLAPDRLRCGAGCFGGLCSTDRALHVGRAAARLAGPAAVCLPAAAPAQSHAHASSLSKCSARRVLHEGMRCARKLDGRLPGTAANDHADILTR